MILLSLFAALLIPADSAAQTLCVAEPGDRVVGAPTLDPAEVAYALAPVVFVEGASNLARRHWDLPSAVDFDGDRVGRNNGDNMRSGRFRDRIVPTLYWSVIETETHVFATYHSFHAQDWTWYPNILNYEWHENDGENLQVVARKTGPGTDGLVIELVAAQAHLDTHFATVGAAFANGSEALSSPAWTVSAAGRSRAAIYMERGGHGLYPAAEKAKRFESGEALALKRGIRLSPARGPVGAPTAEATRADYQLLPTEQTFWTPTLAGEILGDGKLMDRTFAYCDALVGGLTLPRHYDSDAVAGPGKTDSGISPFAFDRRLHGTGVQLGALFFDPARRYAELFDVPDGWSDRYVGHPYATTATAVLESPAPP